MIKVTGARFDPATEVGDFEKRVTDSGAIVTFLGKVRPNSHVTGKVVTGLYLEHFAGMTEKSIMDIATEAKTRWAINDIHIVHRYGVLQSGDPIVLVCVAATHRRAAFEAADFLMDYLKAKALFWKKEIYEDGEVWIEPRSEDYEDLGRWSLTSQRQENARN